MKSSEEIIALSNEILVDLSENRIPLHCVLLKAARLAMLTGFSSNITTFQTMSKLCETKSFLVDTFQSSVDAAKDPNISYSSANPNQVFYGNSSSNMYERSTLRKTATESKSYIANCRASANLFAMNIYQKYRLGSIAENIFEKKRERTDPLLVKMLPNTNEILNSIEMNIKSRNQEDWKNAVTSCRTLLMDFADIINPAQNDEEKGKYINRLKDFISSQEESKTRTKLLGAYIGELKKRIEYTANLTQGSAHQVRPTLAQAEDIVLMTYLVIADILEIYKTEEEKKNNFNI